MEQFISFYFVFRVCVCVRDRNVARFFSRHHFHMQRRYGDYNIFMLFISHKRLILSVLCAKFAGKIYMAISEYLNVTKLSGGSFFSMELVEDKATSSLGAAIMRQFVTNYSSNNNNRNTKNEQNDEGKKTIYPK